MAMEQLNDRQRRFVEAMLVEPNAVAAYVEAGYKARGPAAEANASRMLRNDKVKAALEGLRQERSERVQLSADDVMEELRRVGFSDLRQLASWTPEIGLTWKSSDKLDDEAAAAIKDIQFTREIRTEKNGTQVETTNTNLKLHDKLGALKSLGQHLGMFGKGTADGGGVTVNVNNNMPPAKPLSDFSDAELDFYEKLLDTESVDADSNRRA